MNSRNKFIVIAILATLFSCEPEEFCIGYKYIDHQDFYKEVSLPCEWYNIPIRDMGYNNDKELILFFLEDDTVWSVDESEWWLNTLNTQDLLSINTYESIKPYRQW